MSETSAPVNVLSDEEQLAELIQYLGDIARDMSWRFKISRQITEDLASEALLRLVQCPPETILHPKGWLTRVMFNLLMSHFRSGAVRREVLQNDVISDIPEPPEAWTRREVQAEVRCVLRSLDEEKRLLLFLQYFAELTRQQISSLVKRPPGTVSCQLHKAKAAFRRHWHQKNTSSKH